VFADALNGDPADHRAAALIRSGLICVAPKDRSTLLAEVVTEALEESAAT
jgi:hypothetical protein